MLEWKQSRLYKKKLYTTRKHNILQTTFKFHFAFCSIYFKGRNFRGKKLSRFRKTVKYLHFEGINFRGWRLMKNFAGINFRGEPLSKDFPGIKKGEILNLWEETFVFIVMWLRWDTLPVLKSLKKSLKKTCFPLFFLSWVLNFWNFTNATIIWYHNYKSIFFSEY